MREMWKKILYMILIPLKNCAECKHCTSEKVYTADSWEDVNKFICRETKRKKNEISGYHERFIQVFLYLK